jgi:hypothetical protein
MLIVHGLKRSSTSPLLTYGTAVQLGKSLAGRHLTRPVKPYGADEVRKERQLYGGSVR